MAESYEYTQKLTFSLDELAKAVEVQAVLVHGARTNRASNLVAASISSLGVGSTLLGLLFVTSTPVGIAAGIASLTSTALGASLHNYFLGALEHGHEALTNRLAAFAKSAIATKYKRIEFEVAFVEYNSISGKTRYIIGAGPITRMQTNSGAWISST